MRIVVSDSCCLIDLKKGGLLEAFLDLPYEFIIPDVLVDNELLSLTKKEVSLLKQRMKIVSLDVAGTDRVRQILFKCPALTAQDGFAFVMAEQNPGCILVTGDRRLRALAEEARIEVHGVLWVVDELEKNRTASIKTLLAALTCWRRDPSVRLPKEELTARLAFLGRHK